MSNINRAIKKLSNITEEQALALYDSGFWKDLSYKERAVFQIFTERLCMPFGVFHEAVEKAIGRPVFSHEFGRNVPGLKNELMNNGPAPTMEEIINMIPKDKQIIFLEVKND